MKARHYALAILLIPLLVLLRFVAEIGEREPDMHRVTTVIDGDTVELDNGEKLRLAGIDTPEHDEPFSESAKAFLTDMVLHKKVRVEFGKRKRGGHGRLLGYLYVDNTLVNVEILRQGLGWIYLFPDTDHDNRILEELYAAQRAAMAAQVGVWTLPSIDEDHYIGNIYRMRFHRPDCVSVRGLEEDNRMVFERREDAFFDGYAPCRNCRP